ncbi:hypothetical protein PQU92_09545 [Asticcacaulis sp. BYS171W]|uniref:Uncharacterized protein n=1 Tax=Asticcacaulis aquaticus TaxID=2984212 RepID=A0ABT5HU07_9CAUL|nr:hypothetical protein [Asticcacaulis aquaticus]MDC7683519.1 hypothetical protein [Asticcacaulis aquaticus]
MSTNESDDGLATRADLAFVRALVDQAPKAQGSAGLLFMVGGGAYGVQCLVYWGEIAGFYRLPPLAGLLTAILPIVIFLVPMIWVIIKERGQQAAGVATRAMNAAYASTGLVNLVMILVFGTIATREKSMLIWLIYPIVICALQGGAWYVAYMIRRKLWLMAVAIGWFAAAATLGFIIHDIGSYLLGLALALIGLMGVPGYVMWRLAKRG